MEPTADELNDALQPEPQEEPESAGAISLTGDEPTPADEASDAEDIGVEAPADVEEAPEPGQAEDTQSEDLEPAEEAPIDETTIEEPAPPMPWADEQVTEAIAVEEAAAEERVEPAGLDLEEAAEEEEIPEWQPGEWFVVHTYAGYENKVKTNLESRIVSMNMEEKIYEVIIPTEDVMEVKSGKKQVVQRKVFPGYLLVRMDLDDDSWYVVRNTPGVTGFVGSGTKPIPLSDKEVDRVLQRRGPEERPKPRLEFATSDNVRVVTGPFANFQGIISEIDADRSKLKVLVNIFGRETPVELGFDQVAKI